MSEKPQDADVIGYLQTLSNWGRWGDDDRLGTLNLITDDVRRAAAGTVRDGTAYRCRSTWIRRIRTRSDTAR
jgi:hypothetical protein